jgi:hypothetical protein
VCPTDRSKLPALSDRHACLDGACAYKSSTFLDPCGKPAKFRITHGPSGNPSTIDGQLLCGRHANFWTNRGFVTEPLAASNQRRRWRLDAQGMKIYAEDEGLKPDRSRG